MNFATILVTAAIAALLVLAVRYLVKNGVCAACVDAKSCRSAASAGPGTGCGHGCAGCPHAGACHPK